MTHKQMESYFSKELKPCPFCNGKAVLVQWRDTKKPNATWIECGGCEVMTSSFHDKEYVKAIAKAVRVWNRRK